MELYVVSDLEGAFNLCLGLLSQARNEAGFYPTLKNIELVEGLFVLSFFARDVNEAVGHDSDRVANATHAFFNNVQEFIQRLLSALSLEWQIRVHNKVRI